MTVYVDDMRAPYGRMVLCHMIADSTEELLEMADRIGVERRWIQAPGTWREHFDIARSKRELAVQHGAVEVTQRALADMLAARRTLRMMRELKPGDRVTWRRQPRGGYGYYEMVDAVVVRLTERRVRIRVTRRDGAVVERSVKRLSLREPKSLPEETEPKEAR